MSRLTIPSLRARSYDVRARAARLSSKTRARVGLLGLILISAACGAGQSAVPPPRPIIIYSGARLRVEQERMREVYDWFTAENTNIEQDPSFWVISEPGVGEVYPWDGLRISNDTVWVTVPAAIQDPQRVFMVYAHQHLMSTMGRQEEWLPEAPDAVGFDLEKAILTRTADAWILGRTVFGTIPYGPLDELAYTREAGLLDAFIFTARPNEFASTRTAWARQNPGEMERFREWFLETFNREPPGLRPG